MTRRLIGLAVFSVLAIGALVAAGFTHYQSGDAIAGQGAVSQILVAAVDLSRDQKPALSGDDQKVTFVGGWALTSKHDAFGGFSGIVVDGKGGSLLAISDKGDWWQSAFDARLMMPPTTGSMQRFSSGMIADKIDLDAESLIKFGGGLLVSFEHNHRLEFVAEVGAEPVKPQLAPIDFSGISGNGGMEAIALLQTGELLVFSERGLNGAGNLQAWLVSADATEALKFKPPTNFSPTDAAVMPNGDVLVLLRHFSAIDGVAIKVHHIKAADIVAGAALSGEEILHLTPEFTVDNMEGLDVVVIDNDTVRLVMISDDNFNPLQRTLLMMFDYNYR